MHNSKLSDVDKQILNNYIPLVKGISLVYGSNCEVSLHSTEDLEHSVIAIENGDITGRDIGSPMIPLIRERVYEYIQNSIDDNGDDVIGIFYSYNKNGHPLKSTVSLIRNLESKIIGCIGIHVDVGIPLHEFVNGFIPSVNGGMMDEFSEHTPKAVDQLIFSSLKEAINLANSQPRLSAIERNHIIVKELNQRGIFNIRGAVEIVAKELGTSRYTIYNYLRDIKLDTP